MTDEMMTLRALLGKSSDADLLREMIVCVPKTQIRTYWWCSPPRSARDAMRPLRWIGRDTGASLFKDRQHIADLFVLLPGYSDLPLTE